MCDSGSQNHYKIMMMTERKKERILFDSQVFLVTKTDFFSYYFLSHTHTHNQNQNQKKRKKPTLLLSKSKRIHLILNAQ